MIRLLTPILFLVVIFCAIKVVESQYLWRIRYNDLYQAEKAANKYKQVYGQLLLEQSTLSAKVEDFAAQNLKMQRPDETRIQVIAMQAAKRTGVVLPRTPATVNAGGQ